MQRFEDQHGQLKLNSLTNRQSTKLTENWGDVTTRRAGDQP